MKKNYVKYCLIIVIALASFSPIHVHADSPLTSINFWSISKEKLVLKTGKKKGKKLLSKKMIKFLLNSEHTTFDKIALVNAIGWDARNKIKNSDIFIKSIEKLYLKSPEKFLCYLTLNENEFLNLSSKEKIECMDLTENLYLIYLYLKAMDDYTNVDYVNQELENYWMDDLDCLHLMKGLISAQQSTLKIDFCKAGNSFIDNWHNYDCSIENLKVKSAIRLSNKYLGENLKYCETINFYVGNPCMPDELIAKSSQLVQIIHYPTFIYGKLEIYNSANIKIKDYKIDGDDYINLNLIDYPIGSYTLKMDDIDKNKFEIKLIII
jgi:hypothetical protein